MSKENRKTKFIYREFHDVPRMLILRHRDRQLLLESRFDDIADEYESIYRVFVLPNIPDQDLRGSWEGLSKKATAYLGELPVSNVVLDHTLRQEIDTTVLDGLLPE